MIVEMDHPATQSMKRALFSERGFKDPDNLSFFPIDLEEEDFRGSLAKTGLDLSRPVWISCLGVLAYLSGPTVHGIFEALSALASGSGIVFAFAPEKGGPDEASYGRRSAADRAAELGEPWITRFTKAALREELQGCGFAEIGFLEPENAEARYYKDRSDLPPPGKVRLCRSVV